MQKQLNIIIKERIKEIRLERGFTIEEVAKKIRVTRSTIGNYENGIRLVSVVMLDKLAKLYKCNPAYLAGWSNNKKIRISDKNSTK